MKLLSIVVRGIKLPLHRRPIDIIIRSTTSEYATWPESKKLRRSLLRFGPARQRRRHTIDISTYYSPLPNDTYQQYRAQVRTEFIFHALDGDTDDFARRLLEGIEAAEAGLVALKTQLTVSVL